MESCEITIVGAGVIGLAIAREVALAGREVVILEQEGRFGSHCSSRNSEVIHAGLYYPADSLKARFCVEGRHRLYDYCRRRSIDFRRCGKLIVGQDEAQGAALQAIVRQGEANGVEDLRLLDGAELRALEPALKGGIGLLSPSTGIVDSHGLMQSLLGEATEREAVIAYHSQVTALALRGEAVEIHVNKEAAPSLSTRLLINAAGLFAPALAGRIEGFPAAFVPRAWLARGCYFTLSGKTPFRHLIYPLPEEGGLGVHLTLDLAGQARFGPDVEWIDAIDYRVEENRAASFYRAIRAYWPDLKDGALLPGYAGIRPKLAGPGMAPADFRIDGPAQHGMRGVINLFGIESPGLTASLAIAAHVRDLALAIL
jgi:L-2-hydroxyglutarate oxidase LhgO